jgi:hypothetical protein
MLEVSAFGSEDGAREGSVCGGPELGPRCHRALATAARAEERDHCPSPCHCLKRV